MFTMTVFEIQLDTRSSYRSPHMNTSALILSIENQMAVCSVGYKQLYRIVSNYGPGVYFFAATFPRPLNETSDYTRRNETIYKTKPILKLLLSGKCMCPPPRLLKTMHMK